VREITVEAAVDQIKPVTDFVNQQLDALACSTQIRIQIDVAIDEIFSNIARYAYSEKEGTATVRVDVEKEPLSIIITFSDHGEPFDPLSKETPNTIGLPARKRPIGGLGLFMVRKTMDAVSYSYEKGQNILKIRKKI
jgi:anti-sigma regulatory factor (Ser/Thr protein kinase)